MPIDVHYTPVHRTPHSSDRLIDRVGHNKVNTKAANPTPVQPTRELDPDERGDSAGEDKPEGPSDRGEAARGGSVGAIVDVETAEGEGVGAIVGVEAADGEGVGGSEAGVVAEGDDVGVGVGEAEKVGDNWEVVGG